MRGPRSWRALALLPLLLATGLPPSAAGSQEKRKAPLGPITRVVEVVKEGEDRPLAGITVEAWGIPGGKVVKATGADGTVRFEGVPRKDVTFVARLPGFTCGWHEPGRWWWQKPKEDGDPDGDGVTRMRLVLRPGSVVEGRVLSAVDDRPIAGALVEAWERPHATDIWYLEGAPLWVARTDAEGLFRTTEGWPKSDAKAPAGRVLDAVVHARAPGWIHEESEIWPHDAGRQEALSFRLLPAGTIRGIVTGADGKPAAGAIVRGVPPNDPSVPAGPPEGRAYPTGHPRMLVGVADALGAFELPEAFPGTKYFLYAEAEEKNPDPGAFNPIRVARSPLQGGVVVTAQGAVATCSLRMRRLGAVVVRVAPDAGGDAKDLRVELKPPADVRQWALDSEEDGITRFREIDPGTWTLDVEGKGWLPLRRTVTVPEGETVDLTVRLSAGVTIDGVVVDDAGAGVAGVMVYAYAVDPAAPDVFLDGYGEGKTDGKGAFRITGLREGPTALGIGSETTFRDDGYLRVSAPATAVRFPVHKPIPVRIHLLLPVGERHPPRLVVTVTTRSGPSPGSQWQVEVEGGAEGYVLGDLLPGKYDIAVDAPGFAPFVSRIELKPGPGNTPPPFRLDRGIPFAGRVVDGDGQPVPGAQVMPWGNRARTAATGDDGAFTLPHLAEGPVDLSVKAPGMAETLLVVTVAADAPPVDVVVRGGGLVRGSCLPRDPKGPFTTSLDLFPAGSRSDRVTHWRAEVTKGEFSIRLPAGRYRCPLGRESGEPGPFEFDVVEGEEIDLHLIGR